MITDTYLPRDLSADDIAILSRRYLTPIKHALAPAPAPVVDVKATGNRRYQFIISSAAVDSYGDSIDPNGFKLDRYLRNPVVLRSHDSYSMPVGRGVDTRVSGKYLVSTVEFPSPGVSAAADDVVRLIQEGMLRGASIGARPLKLKRSADPNRPYGFDISEMELYEWSIVSVPANPECLLRSFSETPAPKKSQAMSDRDARAARTAEIDLLRRRQRLLENKPS